MDNCSKTRPPWFRLVPVALGVISLAAHAEGMRIPRPSSGLVPNPAQGKLL